MARNLSHLLDMLRALGGDYTDVEVKSAAGGRPESLMSTLTTYSVPGSNGRFMPVPILATIRMADSRALEGKMPEQPRAQRKCTRPVAVPDGLALLTGPTSGTVTLPPHLDWSGNAEYDLDRPGRIVDLYRTVINEAATPADLHTLLDATTLKRLWSCMWLPIPVRRAWENRFPELAQISRLASA